MHEAAEGLQAGSAPQHTGQTGVTGGGRWAAVAGTRVLLSASPALSHPAARPLPHAQQQPQAHTSPYAVLHQLSRPARFSSPCARS